MLGNRHSQHSFAKTPAVKMARSQFDRSFAAKDTMDFDILNPIFVDEILPGDTCNVNVHSFARLATQLKPIMDNMYVDFSFFFVPMRLVWENWERFQGAQDNPGDSTDFLIPQVTIQDAATVGSIYDKYDLPTVHSGFTTYGTRTVNALPFRAYNLIWNQWYRDENLQNSISVPKDNGPDAKTVYNLKKRGKRHDYFTSALPWPQKGPSVEIPLGSSAPIVESGSPQDPAFWRNQLTGTAIVNGSNFFTDAGGVPIFGTTSAGSNIPVHMFPQTSWIADLSAASAATINLLRQSFSIQSIYELDARGGTRYVETLLSRWNVTSPDFRLQRPEYLGGGKTKINSHPVAQTAPTDGGSPQGNLAAFATMSTGGTAVGFTKSFVEHGYVIGLMSARADLTYQQGLPRMYSRLTRFDFAEPKLQELGEQAILNQEIYLQGTSADLNVFGYQERFAEYRYGPSRIRGSFRSTYATSIDQWHLAEEFGTLPSLNGTFIESNTPIERALAVTDEPHLLVDLFFQYKHARALMTYGIPSTLGKF